MKTQEWHTLKEAARFLSNNNKQWDQRQVLKATIDYGIFTHIYLKTSRPDIVQSEDPKLNWMARGEWVELPFNVDLGTFFKGGCGLITIVRRKDIIYKFGHPGIQAEIEDIHLSRAALLELKLKILSRQTDNNIVKLRGNY